LAEKVCDLESADQLAIAERIGNGEDARKVVLEYLPPRKVDPKTASSPECLRLVWPSEV
jgi:hypothetical protein